MALTVASYPKGDIKSHLIDQKNKTKLKLRSLLVLKKIVRVTEKGESRREGGDREGKERAAFNVSLESPICLQQGSHTGSQSPLEFLSTTISSRAGVLPSKNCY